MADTDATIAPFWLECEESQDSCANTETALIGADNKGRISGNSNIRVISNDSTLDIVGNASAKFMFLECKVAIHQNKDCNVDCTGAEVEARANSKFKLLIRGKNKLIKFLDNVNFSLEGCGIRDSTFHSNNNVHIVMKGGGDVLAVNNQDCIIAGEGCQKLRLEQVRGHTVTSVRGNENAFCISLQPAEEVGQPPSLRCNVGYVRAACIEGCNYTVGKYKWRVGLGVEEVKLLFDHGTTEMSVEQLNVKCVKLSPTAISAEPNQEMKVQGPHSVKVMDAGGCTVIITVPKDLAEMGKSYNVVIGKYYR